MALGIELIASALGRTLVLWLLYVYKVNISKTLNFIYEIYQYKIIIY